MTGPSSSSTSSFSLSSIMCTNLDDLGRYFNHDTVTVLAWLPGQIQQLVFDGKFLGNTVSKLDNLLPLRQRNLDRLWSLLHIINFCWCIYPFPTHVERPKRGIAGKSLPALPIISQVSNIRADIKQ